MSLYNDFVMKLTAARPHIGAYDNTAPCNLPVIKASMGNCRAERRRTQTPDYRINDGRKTKLRGILKTLKIIS